MSNKQIEVLVRGVLVRRGRILVCQGRGADNVFLPGGHVEFGEAAATALALEWREELGVSAKVGRFLGAVEHTYRQKSRAHCEVNFVFVVTCPALSSAADPESEEDWIRFRWISLAALSSSHLEPAPLCRQLPRWLATAHSGLDCWASTLPAT